jgi:hypothetical protein
MLIRTTPHACFVILRNGLTLELFYDETLTGARGEAPADPKQTPSASQGVWLMGESVVMDVRAGQA